MDIPLYDFDTIAAATDRFSDGNKLGQGGFGPVYKGKLGEDQNIAVKRLAKTSLQGTEEFKNEVMLIAKLQNRNLVQLLGCCIEGEERMLIYEYMPNKSLDAFLFVKEKSELLDWRTRYRIIAGITRGLFYLHHDSRFRIIHRDLKASNILLDEKMNPKISDFGMARLFGGDETDFNTRKVVGTYGYMSPEHAMQGTFSLKSDVFSFGVLLLEIISGKKNRGIYTFSSHLNLVAHAWSLWNEGDILELVDESMSNTFPRNDVLKCIKIGLLCVEDQPDDRPLMSSVIEMLGAEIASLPQPKQPGFIGRTVPLEFDRLENRQSSVARDTITPNQPLFGNETLVSSGNRFALGFFTAANSDNRYVGIWYNNIADQTVVWVANRVNPVTNSSGLLSITSEGVLEIVDGNSVVVWSVNATGLANPVAHLLDTGNLVVKDRDATENYAWEGFNTPSDTILPGMKIRVDPTSGLNHTLRSWKSDTDPSPGEYYAYMDISGDPELYLYSGSEKIWRTGAWDGLEFSGSPNSSSREGLFRSVVSNSEGMVYSFVVSNDSVLSRIVINESGLVQRSVWLWDSNQWSIFWYAPRDPCDRYGQCGTYGACDTDNSQTCECLPAFAPKNPRNWALRDGTDGCIRETRLDCKNGTDEFVAVRNVKLPDSTNCTVDRSLSLDECREMCLRNCSCTAYASADISGGGTGCIIWVSELVDIRVYVGAGQDLYVRLAAADIASYFQSHKRKSKMVGIIVGLLSGTLLLSCVGCFLWKRKKMRRVILGATNFSGDKLNEDKRRRDLGPPFFEFGEGLAFPVFDFGTIAYATDFFLEGNKLGEGGFGPVYKGKLGEHQEIAVKRLAASSQQGTEEFKNEVMLIAKLQNVNLVRLLGCCVQGEERMLIYEYMPNKSLDAFLFDNEKAALLDWETRYKIIVGISRGLLYLHHDSRYRIIHRDLKASNILLDEEMNPKISDFGMARLFGGNVTDYNTLKVVGTYGYMSPEYAMQGIFSLKSDVFSFGVLLLEIVSGKRNRGSYAFSSHPNLVAHAWSLWNEGESWKIVEESTGEIFPKNEVLKCIQIGLLCVQEHPEDRPLMSDVILMFGTDITSLQQPKQPGFIARMCSLDSDQIPNLRDLCTSNELTVTVVGR